MLIWYAGFLFSPFVMPTISNSPNYGIAWGMDLKEWIYTALFAGSVAFGLMVPILNLIRWARGKSNQQEKSLIYCPWLLSYVPYGGFANFCLVAHIIFRLGWALYCLRGQTETFYHYLTVEYGFVFRHTEKYSVKWFYDELLLDYVSNTGTIMHILAYYYVPLKEIRLMLPQFLGILSWSLSPEVAPIPIQIQEKGSYSRCLASGTSSLILVPTMPAIPEERQEEEGQTGQVEATK
jgi:hypothetical protein